MAFKLSFLSLARFFLYASLFSVIIVMPSTFFPFIGGKYYFFRLAVEAALICVVLWWAFESKRDELLQRLRALSSQPLFIAVSVFVLIYLLAALLAHNPQGAFWSNYERGEGGFQMLHYYVFFVLAGFLFVKREHWLVVFRVSLVAALFMIGYGILANLQTQGFISPYRTGEIPPTAWGKIVSTRFQGSLGNPAYVAPYLLFVLFYTFYLWFNRAWNNRTLQRFFYGGLAVIYLFFFMLSQTRGAFLGLAAGLFVFMALLAFMERRLRKWALSGLVLLVVFGGALYSLRATPFVKSLPGSRVLEISLSERAFQTRFWTWNSALQGFKERPILGWGPENFSAVFDKYFDSRHYIPGQNTETWFDRAHSVIFDYLSETGILGLLSFLGMFALFYVLFFKRLFRSHPPHAPDAPAHTPFQRALIFSLPAAYLVQGLVIFDVLPIYINLFLFLGFANFVFESRNRVHDTEVREGHRVGLTRFPPAFRQIIGTAAGVLIIGLAYYGSYLPLRKSQSFIATLGQTRNIRTVAEFRTVFSKPLDAASPIGQEELVRNMSQVILGIVQSNGAAGSPEVTRDLVSFVDEYSDPIIKRGRGMSFSQNLYILGALHELAFSYTKDTAYLDQSKQFYLKGLELGPRRPQPLYGLFDIYRLENNAEGVKRITDQILEQWPDDQRTKSIYAQFVDSQTKPRGPKN